MMEDWDDGSRHENERESGGGSEGGKQAEREGNETMHFIKIMGKISRRNSEASRQDDMKNAKHPQPRLSPHFSPFSIKGFLFITSPLRL